MPNVLQTNKKCVNLTLEYVSSMFHICHVTWVFKAYTKHIHTVHTAEILSVVCKYIYTKLVLVDPSPNVKLMAI